ncbi:VWA domain-containing protein [Niallia alba]|uniref:VWA domain-containing protein n=1 Tax=Niallia alba TaxID=2729105 RepID=UPI002E1A6AE4|nr:VWA domain-containing protein [Niallia alba]
MKETVRNLPFLAIPQQEKGKTALKLLAVNPRLNGLLIVGNNSLEKSMLADSFQDLVGENQLFKIPISLTEDRLYGSKNLDQIFLDEKQTIQAGLLRKLQNKVGLINQVEQLDEMYLVEIMDALDKGYVRIEREGMSESFEINGSIIAIGEEERPNISQGTLDRFGLYVNIEYSDNRTREKIVKQIFEFTKNPEKVIASFSEKTNELKSSIAKAKKRLADIYIPDQQMKLIAQLNIEAGSQGFRGDIFLAEAAKAHAALRGVKEVTDQDIMIAALYVLPHRLINTKQIDQELNSKRNNSIESDQDEANQEERTNNQSLSNENTSIDELNPNTNALNNEEQAFDSLADEVIVETNKEVNLPSNLPIVLQDSISKIGKRGKTKSLTKQGRHVKSSSKPAHDLDIDIYATIRAAAPFQKVRPKKQDTAISIVESDLRHKIRRRGSEVSFIFIVDASKSMHAEKRMELVKGTIFTLLKDAYKKRDKVAMVTFQGKKAKIVLPVTKSFDLAQRLLDNLPIGGKSPLAQGLQSGLEVYLSAKKKNPDLIPLFVVLTDGKANVGLELNTTIQQSIDDSLVVGKKYKKMEFSVLVIDTEQGYIQMQLAADLANAMGAEYIKIADLKGDNFAKYISNKRNKIRS